MDRYIDSHTSTEKMKVMRNKMSRDMDEVKNTYGTAHKSAAIAFVWRHTLGLGSVREIQEVCREPMARLGYKRLDSQEELDGVELPLDKTAKEVWTPRIKGN